MKTEILSLRLMADTKNILFYESRRHGYSMTSFITKLIMDFRDNEIKEKAIKDYARTKVSIAIKKGILKRTPCIYCGNINTEAHHKNYKKPLEVEWVCKKCHRILHNMVKGVQNKHIH